MFPLSENLIYYKCMDLNILDFHLMVYNYLNNNHVNLNYTP